MERYGAHIILDYRLLHLIILQYNGGNCQLQAMSYKEAGLMILPAWYQDITRLLQLTLMRM